MTTQTQSVATLTFGGRLRRTRGVAVYAVLVVVSLLIGVRAVRETWTWITRPSLNLPVLDDLVVRATVGYWDGTEDGDRLVAVNGVRVTSRAELEAEERALPVGPVTARFARGDGEFELVGANKQPSTTERVAAALRCLVGIVLLLIGGLTFALRPGVRATWLFFVVCVSLGILLLSILAWHRDVVLRNVVPFSLLGVTAGLAVHLFAAFPLPSPVLARRPYLAILLHVPGLALTPALVWSMQVGGNTTPLLLILVWGAIASLGALGLLLSQWRRARRSTDARAQAEVRALAVATMFGMVLPIGWTAAWLLRLVEFPGVAHVATAPFVLFAAVIGYTLVRHNAFDVDRFTAAVVGYAAAAGILGACFLLALVGMPLVLGRFGVPRTPELFVVLTSVAFAAFLPLFRRSRARVDRWFLRAGVDAATQADILRELSFTIQTGDRDRGLRAALAAAMTVSADRAEFWALDDGSDAFARALAHGPTPPDDGTRPLARHGELGASLATIDDARGVAGLAHKLLPPAAQDQLWAKQLALAVPVRAARWSGSSASAASCRAGRSRPATRRSCRRSRRAWGSSSSRPARTARASAATGSASDWAPAGWRRSTWRGSSGRAGSSARSRSSARCRTSPTIRPR